MLGERVEKTKSTLRKMVVVCSDNISRLVEEYKEKQSFLDDWSEIDYQDTLKHYRSLKQEAEETLKLWEEFE